MQSSSDPIPPKMITDEVSKGEMQLYELALEYMKDEKGVEVGAEKSAVKNMKSAIRYLAKSNARFRALDEEMPHSQSAVYKQLYNSAFQFTKNLKSIRKASGVKKMQTRGRKASTGTS